MTDTEYDTQALALEAALGADYSEAPTDSE